MTRYIAALFLASLLHADVLVVATNPKFHIHHLTPALIRALYLDKRHTLHGYRVMLLNLPFNHPLRKRFEKKVLHKSTQELEHYWLIAHYRGHRPPKVVRSQKAAALYIKKITYALGYMKKSVALRYGLKIVYEWK